MPVEILCLENLEVVSSLLGVMALDSLTNVSEFRGHHYWTIRNWRGWVGCSEKDATIYSEKFSIPIINDEGEEDNTQWMVKAFPKKHANTGKDMLAFRLISLNKKTPKGSFHFKTVARNLLGQETTISKFKPLPLDAAYHWMTCIRYHTSETLVIKVKLRIVSTHNVRSAPPLSATSGHSGIKLNILPGGSLFPKAYHRRSVWSKIGSYLAKVDGAFSPVAPPRYLQ